MVVLDPTVLAALGSVVGGAIIFILNYLKTNKQSAMIERRFNMLELKQGNVEKQNNIFINSIVDKELLGELIETVHAPHTPETDKLLEKWECDKLSKGEMTDLKDKISKRLSDEKIKPTSSLYISSKILIAILTMKIGKETLILNSDIKNTNAD